MRQLLPTPLDEVDPLDLYPADERTAPPGRPWLVCNMIASADGATELDGRSGGLGGAADKAVFRAVRASCDWVLVASGTAVAETYSMPSMSAAVAKRRDAAGRPTAPGLAIVTASGRIDPTIPAFAARRAGDAVPLVLAGAAADTEALGRLDADVVRLDTVRPDPHAILAELGRRGARVVLAEGGPTFNATLHAAGVVDELCLSIAPLLVGGTSARVVGPGPEGAETPLRLVRLLEDDGTLFARYVRG